MWLPAGSQAIDGVVWQISALGLRWLQIPRLGSVCRGSQPLVRLHTHPRFQVGRPAGVLGACTHPGALCVPRQPGCLSGRVPTRGFRCGSQATDWGTRPLGHFGSGAQAAGPLIRAHAHLEFQLLAHSLLIWVRTSRASGERWGCFSAFTPGADGGGAPEARAAAESSLTSCRVPLFSFPF